MACMVGEPVAYSNFPKTAEVGLRSKTNIQKDQKLIFNEAIFNDATQSSCSLQTIDEISK